MSTSNATSTLDSSKLIFTGTASRRGRHISITPANSEMAHLHYGRIILDASEPRAAFSTEKRETALLAMRGACSVTVAGTRYDIGLHDAIYIPRSSAVVVETAGEVDLVECAAEVEGTYPLQIIRYAELATNPKLKFRAGGEATTRDLNIVVGDNVKAGRILMGFTRSQHGNWTSWPPHEHTKMLEEVYVYFDMPPPAFGIQLVYDNPERRGAGTQHQLHLDDGGAQRGRGSTVRRGQRPARLRIGFGHRRREPKVAGAYTNSWMHSGSMASARSSRARGLGSARRSRARSPRRAPTSPVTATSTCPT